MQAVVLRSVWAIILGYIVFRSTASIGLHGIG